MSKLFCLAFELEDSYPYSVETFTKTVKRLLVTNSTQAAQKLIKIRQIINQEIVIKDLDEPIDGEFHSS